MEKGEVMRNMPCSVCLSDSESLPCQGSTVCEGGTFAVGCSRDPFDPGGLPRFQHPDRGNPFSNSRRDRVVTRKESGKIQNFTISLQMKY